jgi:hypothetical protein
MQSNAAHNPVSPEALKRSHECWNPPVSSILLVAGLILLMVVGCLLGSRLLVKALDQRRPFDRTAAARGIVVAPDLRLLERFPPPNLQLNSHEDLAALRRHEEAELNSYGWVDPSNRVVRIPIQRAMELIARSGLPARASNAPPRTGKSSLELIRESSQGR